MTASHAKRARVIVLMGVAGSGKSTTAALLRERLGWPYRDADSFHPTANVEKMSRGIPLTDDDRLPWLQAIAHWIDDHLQRNQNAIVTCSALKRSYRELLVGNRENVDLVHLVGSKKLLESRMAARRDHFMPVGLLDSQFATLEEPGPEERVLTIPVTISPDAVVDTIIGALGLPGEIPETRR
ncbi:gluconokinase [Microvirga massiliensis]|uniref:gluconokinase n=1 Tax=Microvirga massiliensis TaxID=1033741 RepID=UPI000AAF22F2